MRYSAITFATLLSLTAAAELEGQRPDLVGEVVRIRAFKQALGSNVLRHVPWARRGRVLGRQGDTLLIRRDGSDGTERWILESGSMVERKVAVPAGRRGAAIGALTGLAIGGIVGLATFEPDSAHVCANVGDVALVAFGSLDACPMKQTNSRGEEMWRAGLMGGLVAGLLGWAIGRTHETDGWIPVPGAGIRMGVGGGRVGDGWGPTVRVMF